MQTDIIRIVLGRDFNFDIRIDGIVILVVIILLLIGILFRRRLFPSLRSMEINEAELGLGNQKIKLRPNTTDLQIAYKIWVELSTRKIGLPLAFFHDLTQTIWSQDDTQQDNT